MAPPMIVTIDGPAGAGKSTAARLIAAKLGYAYLDTGALYRAVAMKALATGTDPTDAAAMAQLCGQTRLMVAPTSQGDVVVTLDGTALTNELREPEVSRVASLVAAIPKVRAWLLPIQQAFGRDQGIRGIVAEGRDIGTRIFPDAPAKFFLEADAAERARRRYEELRVAGERADLLATRRDLDARDERDRVRESSPLAPASDAIVIDTTGLSIEQVVERMLTAIKARAATPR